MNKTILSKEIAEAQSYAPPVCQVINIDTQGVICTSETEKVTEIDGEWYRIWEELL